MCVFVYCKVGMSMLTRCEYILNKEYINSVHVSSTQELHRMIKKQEDIINNLISRIEALE